MTYYVLYNVEGDCWAVAGAYRNLSHALASALVEQGLGFETRIDVDVERIKESQLVLLV